MKIAFLTSHPIQYQVPFFRKLDQEPGTDLRIYFCLDIGVKKYKDPEFGKEIKWDIPLLEGYKYKFLKNYSPKPKPFFFGQINFGIIKELYKNKYDAIIVHGWNSFTNILAIVFAKIFGAKVFLRGIAPLNQEFFKPKLKIFFKKILFFFFFKLIDAFLYVGEENKNFYKFYGVKEKKIFFCPYAVENERFIKSYSYWQEKRKALREKLGIKENDVVILFAGKLIEKKRPLVLLKAYEKISVANKFLIFVGQGKLKEEMENYIKRRNLKNIIITGFVNQKEISKYYALADIFVLPSGLGETWGAVVNEAMCCKLPIIVSDLVGCGKDLVREEENGYLFKVNDVDDLSKKLEILVKDKQKREKFGQKSFQIIQNYSYENDIKGLLKAFQSLK